MTIKEKTVFAVVVKTRHFLADVFQHIKNVLGMNLTSYETMIEDAIEEAMYKLHKKFPDVYEVKLATTQVTNGACEVIVYGKVKINNGSS